MSSGQIVLARIGSLAAVYRPVLGYAQQPKPAKFSDSVGATAKVKAIDAATLAPRKRDVIGRLVCSLLFG